MKFSVKFIVIVLIAEIIACNSNSKSPGKTLIPKDKFISLMVDLYLLDGTLSVYKVQKETRLIPKTKVYNDLIESKGFSREAFEYSMNVYAVDPDEFGLMIDEVTLQLNKKNDLEEFGIGAKPKESENLWVLKDEWYFPRDGRQKKVEYTMPSKGLGIYTLEANIKMYEDDESDNPELKAWFYYDNGTPEGYKDEFKVAIKKSGKFEMYRISKKLTNESVTKLMIVILDHSEKPGSWKKHAEIKNIKLTHTPREFKLPPGLEANGDEER